VAGRSDSVNIKYVDRKFSLQTEAIILTANRIIAEYAEQGFDLTLRQLYYQFVARDILPNKQSEYSRLGSIVNDARLAGRIDWNAIVDRTRNLRKNSHWDHPRDIVQACAEQYQIDKWVGQEAHVEVWIEKDALIGIVESVCDPLDVPYFSCRGYTSQSEMWQASQRLIFHAKQERKCVIIHLGDHDPSGKDMSRDIKDRLNLFMDRADQSVVVRRIALNMNQIEKYKPPPNPAKITDSRAKAYISEFGTESWELDALDPKVLAALITRNITDFIDKDLWDERVRLQQEHRDVLVKAAKRMKA
jgi:hypothetical protein